MQRLSTGLRINSAKDDAAGLAIANKLSFQVGGLNQASDNSTHGVSLVQTAEGALTEVHQMLQRMRELAVQAANDTNTPRDRQIIQREIDQLTEEVHMMSQRTEFNRMRVLAGEADRITRNFDDHNLQGTQVRNIVTTLYISEQVPAGHLNYTITQIGKPAVLPVTLTPNTNIVINGTYYAIGSSGSHNDIIAGLESKGIRLLANGNGGPNDFFLVSEMAGSNQTITASGFGTATGQDAIIEGLELYDSLGNPINNTFLASTSEGNQVFIRGSRGEDIRINIQVDFDPLLGIFQVGTTSIPNIGGAIAVIDNFPFDRDFTDYTAFSAGPPIIPEGAGRTHFTALAMALGIPNSIISGWNSSLDAAAGIAGELLGTAHADYAAFLLELQDLANWDGTAVGATQAGFDAILNPIKDRLNARLAELSEMDLSKEFRDFGPLMLQVGANHNNSMRVQIPKVNAETLGLVEFVAGERRSLISYRSREGAEAALDVIDRAINTTAIVRSRLGAYQNRLESTIRSLDTTAENTEQSRSRIQDANIAVESTRLATYNVMFQAAQAILSQANQRPQQLISLLQ